MIGLLFVIVMATMLLAQRLNRIETAITEVAMQLKLLREDLEA